MLIEKALISSTSTAFSWLFTLLLTMVDLDLPLMIEITLKYFDIPLLVLFPLDFRHSPC